jgi:hypothetical protein
MSGVSTNAPVPSKHLFLHEVTKEAIGTKVRFLCWYAECSGPSSDALLMFASVLDYEVSKAYLHVEHRYPQDAGNNLSFAVEITHVLSTINATELQAGSWLNVIGYVRRSQSSRHKRKRAADPVLPVQPQIIVQAILIWNAGAIKITEYEKILIYQHEARKLAAAALVNT